MDQRTAGALLVCTAQIILAAVVVLNNPRALVNRLFGLSVLTIVGWISTITFALSANDLWVVVWLGRLGFDDFDLGEMIRLRADDLFQANQFEHREKSHDYFRAARRAFEQL